MGREEGGTGGGGSGGGHRVFTMKKMDKQTQFMSLTCMCTLFRTFNK